MRMSAYHPSRPFATVAVEGSFGVKRRQSFAYSGRSLTRISPASPPAPPPAPPAHRPRVSPEPVTNSSGPAGGKC